MSMLAAHSPVAWTDGQRMGSGQEVQILSGIRHDINTNHLSPLCLHPTNSPKLQRRRKRAFNAVPTSPYLARSHLKALSLTSPKKDQNCQRTLTPRKEGLTDKLSLMAVLPLAQRRHQSSQHSQNPNKRNPLLEAGAGVLAFLLACPFLNGTCEGKWRAFAYTLCICLFLVFGIYSTCILQMGFPDPSRQSEKPFAQKCFRLPFHVIKNLQCVI